MSSDNKIGKFRQGQIGVGSQGVCIQISEEITHRVVLQKKRENITKSMHGSDASRKVYFGKSSRGFMAKITNAWNVNCQRSDKFTRRNPRQDSERNSTHGEERVTK